MYYHAHVYWKTQEQRLIALVLRDMLSKLDCSLGRVWDEPIGPHPLPMYQVNFNSKNYKEVVSLLKDKNISILIHEDTGDDLRDHTAGATWLGQKLELDLAWLEEYVRRQK